MCALDLPFFSILFASCCIAAEDEYGRRVALDVVEAFEEVDACVVVVDAVFDSHHVGHHLEPHVHPIQDPVELLCPLLRHPCARQLDDLDVLF